MGDFGHRAIMTDAQHLAVLAARQKRGAIGIANAGEQAFMGLRYLFPAIETVNGTGGGGKQRDIAQKMRRDDVAFKVKRSNGWHGR